MIKFQSSGGLNSETDLGGNYRKFDNNFNKLRSKLRETFYVIQLGFSGKILINFGGETVAWPADFINTLYYSYVVLDSPWVLTVEPEKAYYASPVVIVSIIITLPRNELKI